MKKANFQELTIEEIKNLNFTTISAAKKRTGISYIGGVNISAKTEHGAKYDIDTYIIYLAPSNQSGVLNTCPKASKECAASCLHNAGRAKLEDLAGLNTIKQCRINRTKLFFYNRRFFMSWIIAEITSAKNKAVKKGNLFAVRLNGTSDIKFENIKMFDSTIFQIFPNITFYDYTKISNREISTIKNYSLTFSYTGHNILDSIETLERGENVAIVFDTKRGEQLPDIWRNFPVLDGDVTDYRPNDLAGHVVGLRFKFGANKANNEAAIASPFIVNANDLVCATFGAQLPF